MADKHFFKPLLPGFHSHLTIPEAFFLRYIQGRNEETIAKLRSDASNVIWEVKIEDSNKLTGGWKEFVLAHDLRVGDIAVFRQGSDMSFHVTLLGPSCCEIQYGSCLDNETNLEKIQRRKKVKKNPRREAESSSLDPSCFSLTRKYTSLSSIMPDWSLLPEELLHTVSTHLEDCFDVLHAQSVCSTWRSACPFPASLLRPSYSLPSFAEFPEASEDLCTLQKAPLFLFRAKVPSLPPHVLASQYFWGGMAINPTCEYFLGGIGQDMSEDHMELPSPVQCSIKVNIPSTEPTLMKMNDCQIFPLGHEYRMIGWNPESWDTNYRGVAFLPLNKKKGEFAVLLNYTDFLLVLRSVEMRWMRVKETSDATCIEVTAFKGRFYATFWNGDITVYDPYSMIGTPLMHLAPSVRRHLVRSGDVEDLFLVERVVDFRHFVCRVSILDEKAGKWVLVSDLGDRLFFIGHYGNVSCSAKELPIGCGLSGNSIVSTSMSPVTYTYKYGVDTGREEDELNCLRLSRETLVNCLMTSPPDLRDGENTRKQLSTSPVVVLRVEL